MTQETLLKLWCEIHNADYIFLRYFSVYGTEFIPTNPYTGVMNIIANKMINHDVVELFEDGQQQRDFISNKTCAEVHSVACEKLLKEKNVKLILNVGTESSFKIKNIVDNMVQLLSYKGEIVYNKKMRKGDIKDSIANNKWLISELGYKPVSTFERDLKSYCTYLKNNWDKFKNTATCEKENKLLREKGLIH